MRSTRANETPTSLEEREGKGVEQIPLVLSSSTFFRMMGISYLFGTRWPLSNADFRAEFGAEQGIAAIPYSPHIEMILVLIHRTLK